MHCHLGKALVEPLLRKHLGENELEVSSRDGNFPRSTLGLRWYKLSNQEVVAGIELEAPKLVHYFSHFGKKFKVFTKNEWEAFGIAPSQLTENHYVKAGNHVWKPDGKYIDAECGNVPSPRPLRRDRI